MFVIRLQPAKVIVILQGPNVAKLTISVILQYVQKVAQLLLVDVQSHLQVAAIAFGLFTKGNAKCVVAPYFS